MPTPSAEQQARFLRDVQQVLTEGEFVSTHKFALLIALVRWAIEHPEHPEGEPVDAAALAPHFVDLYWGHALPFRSRGTAPDALAVATPTEVWPGPSDILKQDRGHQQPRILTLIQRAHRECEHDRRKLGSEERRALHREITQTIVQMPLWKLQTVRTRTNAHEFLYRRGRSDQQLVLQPGVIDCLIAFAPLLEDTVRGAWVRFVLRWNHDVLAPADQLESFLFSDGRAGLEAWRPVLLELQGRRCFYCQRDVRGVGAVDHFLPWARYPRDLGHNFVFAHAECNGAKSDHLAATAHLAAWCKRNTEHGVDLARRFDDAGLPHDWPTLWSVATSLYASAADQGADAWDADKQFAPLSADWSQVLEDHRPTT